MGQFSSNRFAGKQESDERLNHPSDDDEVVDGFNGNQMVIVKDTNGYGAKS